MTGILLRVITPRFPSLTCGWGQKRFLGQTMLHGERVGAGARDDAVGAFFHHQASGRRRLPDFGHGDCASVFCG